MLLALRGPPAAAARNNHSGYHPLDMSDTPGVIVAPSLACFYADLLPQQRQSPERLASITAKAPPEYSCCCRNYNPLAVAVLSIKQ